VGTAGAPRGDRTGPGTLPVHPGCRRVRPGSEAHWVRARGGAERAGNSGDHGGERVCGSWRWVRARDDCTSGGQARGTGGGHAATGDAGVGQGRGKGRREGTH